jgi:signal transduction histidine kinase
MIGGTLFQRFFLRFLIGIGIACIVFMTLVHLFQTKVMDGEWRKDLQQEALWLARHSALPVASMLADAWKTMHSSVRITFYDEAGDPVADSHPERAPIDVHALKAGKDPRGQLAVVEELALGGTLVMSRPYVPSFPSGMYVELTVAIMLILGPMVLLLYPFARSMTTTLQAMGEMAEEVSAGHFGKTLPVSRSDELGRLVTSFNDMSMRLAEAERLNSRLLHDVSHELRSPLGRIQVFAETIVQRPDEKQACVRAIEEEIRLLDGLVEDLLQVARLESDQRSPRQESFSLQHWASEILARLERSTVSKGIAWTARLPEQDAETRGDPQHLALALSNLVDNATHALRGRDDPSIQVEVSHNGEAWTLAVEDNGPGIPEEHLAQVFRRFYRADDHRDRETGGVGLGLSLVRAIAEAHGGEASIDSHVGRGTRVTLSLPIV